MKRILNLALLALILISPSLADQSSPAIAHSIEGHTLRLVIDKSRLPKPCNFAVEVYSATPGTNNFYPVGIEVENQMIAKAKAQIDLAKLLAKFPKGYYILELSDIDQGFSSQLIDYHKN